MEESFTKNTNHHSHNSNHGYNNQNGYGRVDEEGDDGVGDDDDDEEEDGGGEGDEEYYGLRLLAFQREALVLGKPLSFKKNNLRRKRRGKF